MTALNKRNIYVIMTSLASIPVVLYAAFGYIVPYLFDMPSTLAVLIGYIVCCVSLGYTFTMSLWLVEILSRCSKD